MLAGDLTTEHVGLQVELPNYKYPAHPFIGVLQAVTPIPHIGVTVALRDDDGWKIVRTLKGETELTVTTAKD